MHFSLSSVLMSVLFSNIMLMILYFVFRNTDFMIRVGYKLLTLFLSITLLRFLFPLELPITRNILLPEWPSRFLIFIKKTLFSIWGFPVSIWRILLTVWAAGTLVGIIRLICSYTRYCHDFSLCCTDVADQEPYASTIRNICEERRRKNRFRICLTENESFPMIHGLIKPTIHIPTQMNLTDQELYYILSHEAAHYFHGDLCLKMLLKLLCVAYWWNPFVHLLENSFETILEMRVDSYITQSPDKQCKYEYLNCLLSLKKSTTAIPNVTAAPALFLKTPGVAVRTNKDIGEHTDKSSNNAEIADRNQHSTARCRDTVLQQRFHMLLEASARKLNWIQILCLVLITGLYIFSTLFIFEPHYMSPGKIEDIPEFNGDIVPVMPNNSYLIINPNGGYDLYIDGDYMETLPEVDEYMSDLKIYNTIEEVSND